MNLIRLWHVLGLDPAREPVIAITGSGGKTTLLYALAREAAQAGKRVAVTTTTHILCPSAEDGLSVFVWEPEAGMPCAARNSGPPDARSGLLSQALDAGKVAVAGTIARDGKLSAPPAPVFDWLAGHADLLLVEADGAKRLPIKFPNATEPVPPAQTSRTITVAGLSALGKPFGEVCHRASLAGETLGVLPEQPVTPQIMAALLLHGYARYRPLVVLNQADTPELRAKAAEIAALLRAQGLTEPVILSLQQEVSHYADLN